MIPTAKQFFYGECGYIENPTSWDDFYPEDVFEFVIKFAKMHVEAALKAASNQNNHPDSFLESNTWWIPSDSILNAYSKELIK